MAKVDDRVTAADFLPTRTTLPALRRAAAKCEGCPLFARATQTVFGEGPESAAVVFVGEQPGDAEDLPGRPFVGPAGSCSIKCWTKRASTASGCTSRTR